MFTHHLAIFYKSKSHIAVVAGINFINDCLQEFLSIAGRSKVWIIRTVPSLLQLRLVTSPSEGDPKDLNLCLMAGHTRVTALVCYRSTEKMLSSVHARNGL